MADLKDLYARYAETRIQKADVSDQMIEIQKVGEQDVVITPNTFVEGEKIKFNYNNTVVEFDGSAYLRTEYAIPVTTPAVYQTSYFSSTDEWINNDNYLSIVEVSIT